MDKVGVILAALILFPIVNAGACNLEATLLNQDPYPAVQGEYVDLVFQLSGVDGNNCGDITFELLEQYPVIFDPGQIKLQTFSKIKYERDYSSEIQIPYKVRVDSDAIDGQNKIEVKIQNKGDALILKNFSLEVGDSRVDFEVNIKNYDYTSRLLSLEILNIGKSDIKALAIEIPKQETMGIKGSNRVIVGDLDSNEYTSADFEATPSNGEFNIMLIYSDQINVRRTIEKKVSFDSSYFSGRIGDENKSSLKSYWWVILVVLVIFWYWRRRNKSKK